MARCWLYQRWWWLLFIIVFGFFYFVRSQKSNMVTMTNDSSTVPNSRIVVFLREQCDQGTNGTEVLRELQRSYSNALLTVGMVSRAETCEARSRGLEALVQVLNQNATRALVAQLDYNTCDIAIKLADLWNKSLITWTCPQRTEEDLKLSSIVRLSPSPVVLGRALAEVFLHFRWKSVSIIGIDKTAYANLDSSVITALRKIGIIPRQHAVLSHNADLRQVRNVLRPLRLIPCRVIVICIPLEGDLLSHVLIEIDAIQETQIPSTIVLIVYPSNPRPFLPVTTMDEQIFWSIPFSLSRNITLRGSRITNLQEIDVVTNKLMNNVKDESTEKKEQKKSWFTNTNGHATLKNFLALVPFDQRYEVQKLLNGSTSYKQPHTLDYLKEALNVLTPVHFNISVALNSFNNKIFTYGLLTYNTNDAWQPILTVSEQENGLFLQELIDNTFADEVVFDVHCDDQSNCPVEKVAGIHLQTAHILAIILSSLLFALTTMISIILIRKHLLKKRMSKAPYKIILTASDFVFPQFPDTRRVDDGIETMLCCWVQQLQEFGGPEVKKPDLLQGNIGSLRPHLRASNNNLAQNMFNDPCARYNGDLVQLKQLQFQGTFELKGKAMDILVTIHGLRHENLNPLIGCLTEPNRPCLVYENCSRGSLEDVLVQDEIKLDWSFRLSLLTDLVRGMKYLHSSPIRIHGYLTSRNCVIDARWVLKVTDYGLPAFYEAQNIQPPIKTAKDLLWTAPELLRHLELRKRGSQSGDVYSFGIVMQEVVVRGEPFCMLALSPEDIIEKVKKPPPLIRPSVSNGAAPPEAINIMRQCWAENANMRPDFNAVHDLFKKLNHGRKVNFVDTMFQMLEKYSNNLEELIRERTEQLDMEKKKTEQLLNRMLPSSVAEKLKLGMPVDPEEFAEVTIYFSDIVGFTTISAYSTPFQVVDLLNDLYTCFDATINAYNVYKVETIGDAYMVVGGCPVRISDHASQIATMALDLLHQSGKFKLRHLPKTQLRLRIGLHTGPCCAGVVGLTMPRYCLFGDTVNTASRMESTGAPWRIHLSQATRDCLAQVGGYVIEYRGCTELKGKGKMPTYWLLGKQDFDKELPVPPPLGLKEILIDEDLQTIEQHEQKIEAITNQGFEKLSTVTSIDNDSTIECSVVVSLPAIGNTSNMTNVSPSKFGSNQPFIKNNSITTSETSRRVAVSVHDDKCSVEPSFSIHSVTGDMHEPSKDKGNDVKLIPDYNNVIATKSKSNDNQIVLGTPVSMTEVAAAFLSSSSTSVNSISSSVFQSRSLKVSIINDDDLSTPYNHYKCLSQNEHHGKASFEPLELQVAEKSRYARCSHSRSRIKSLDIESSIAAERSSVSGNCRLLRRQFSLDRADEASTDGSASISPSSGIQMQRPMQRLFKQNSVGATNDLERIEEMPGTPIIGKPYRHSASVSLSVDSLTLQ